MLLVSDWEFDQDVTKTFDSHVREHVPLYDEIHKLISSTSQWFIEDYTNVYDIGTSTGEFLKNIKRSSPNKLFNLIGIDSSKEMVDQAKVNVDKNNIDADIIEGDILDDSFEIKNASLVTSILTNQFISIHKRNVLLDKVYRGLNKGSAYIIVEKIKGNNPFFNEMWIELYHEKKLENGLNEKQVMDKSRAIRGILKPLSLNENLKMLHQAGFKDADVFFKWCNFVGIIAVK
ncbi:tRNA methyltransferase [Bacillus velezensis]|nr:tRNA methyltransferase [Bacillus velezensis]